MLCCLQKKRKSMAESEILPCSFISAVRCVAIGFYPMCMFITQGVWGISPTSCNSACGGHFALLAKVCFQLNTINRFVKSL